MKNILIVGVFGDLEDPENNDRLNNILYYCKEFMNVSLVTSNFSHKYKRKRNLNLQGINCFAINTLPYRQNTSIVRFLSHFLLGIRAIPLLWNQTKKADLIYVLSPPLTLPLVQACISKIQGKRIILDFTDVWPQAFTLFIQNPLIKCLFAPLWTAQFFLLKSAHHTLVINNTYKDILNPHVKNKISVLPLGISKISTFQPSIDNGILGVRLKETLQRLKESKEYTLFAFAGNLGEAYNFNLMVDIMNHFQQKFGKVYFIVLGDGLERQNVECLLKAQAEFDFYISGRLDYVDFLNTLKFCDFGFNIYKTTPFISTTYKMYDYIKSDVWLINNLKGDSAELIEQYQIGVNFDTDFTQEGISSIGSLKQVSSEDRLMRFSHPKSDLSQKTLKSKWLTLVLNDEAIF